MGKLRALLVCMVGLAASACPDNDGLKSTSSEGSGGKAVAGAGGSVVGGATATASGTAGGGGIPPQAAGGTAGGTGMGGSPGTGGIASVGGATTGGTTTTTLQTKDAGPVDGLGTPDVEPIISFDARWLADGVSCPINMSGTFYARAARSLGYAGTLDDYSGLYRTKCSGLADCVAACVAAKGTKESCEKGSECIDGIDGLHCLPPTYWRYEKQALLADGDTAEQTLVVINYQDALVLTDFGVQLPTNAVVRGITFDVLRSTDMNDMAVDDSVRVLRAGVAVGEDKKLDKPWTSSLAYVSYGDATDTWKTTWSVADVTSPGFGISLAARYLDTAGNARAYVDAVRVTIAYSTGACP